MKIKSFKPVPITEKDINKIANGLKKYFRERIFDNIFSILDDKNIVFNAKITALLAALKSGRVYYKDNAFRTDTRFSNAIAKELESLGAKFRSGAYFISRGNLPFEIEQAISLIAVKDAAKIATIKYFLDSLLEEEDIGKLFIEGIVDEVFTNLQTELARSTKMPTIEINAPTEVVDIPEDVAKGIEKYWKETDKKADKLHKEWEKKKEEAEKDPNNSGKQQEAEKARQKLADFRSLQQGVAPTIDLPPIIDKRARKIAEDYTYNMKYWVKKWETKEIPIMRQELVKFAQKGARRQEVTEYFKKRWGIAERKAEFLARNELGLASTTLKAVHYQGMGCKYFLWQKSTSKEKRPEHLELAKKQGNQFGIGGINLFRFDNPPIIDPKTGQRGLPKQIYNCECDFVGVYDPDFYLRKYESDRNIIKKVTNAIKGYCEQRSNPVWRYDRFSW